MSVPHALLALLSEGPEVRPAAADTSSRRGPARSGRSTSGRSTRRCSASSAMGSSRPTTARASAAEAIPDHRRGRARSWPTGSARRRDLVPPPRDELVIKVLVALQIPGDRRPRDPAGAPPARDRGHAALHAGQGGRRGGRRARWRSSPTPSSSGSRRSSAGSTPPTSASSSGRPPAPADVADLPRRTDSSRWRSRNDQRARTTPGIEGLRLRADRGARAPRRRPRRSSAASSSRSWARAAPARARC